MNEDEFKGGARYVGGKLEKAVGDVANSRDWKVDGVVDQIAGGAQHAYGRAKSIVGDAVDAAPDLADRARDRLKDAGGRSVEAAERHGKAAADAVRDTPAIWVAGAAIGAYALAWYIHGRRG